MVIYKKHYPNAHPKVAWVLGQLGVLSKSDIERQKLAMKKDEMQTKKEIEKMKSDTALKIARENKNKYDRK